MFAPTNEAFDLLPAGTVDHNSSWRRKQSYIGCYLNLPCCCSENGARLTLMKKIKDGGGKAELKTVQGGSLMDHDGWQ